MLDRLSYDSAKGTVDYRSKASPGHPLLADDAPHQDPWEVLAALTDYVPNKGQQLVRYLGWYSKKNRGLRKKAAQTAAAATVPCSGNLGNPATAAPQKDRFFPAAGTDGGGSLALGRRPGLFLTAIRTRSIRIEFFPPASFGLPCRESFPTDGILGGRPGATMEEGLSFHTLMEPSRHRLVTLLPRWKGRSEPSAAPYSTLDPRKTTGSLLTPPFPLDFAVTAPITC